MSSAGGHMIFLLGEERKACLIMWSSKTIKSTTAAEGLAFAEGLENAIFLQEMLQELLGEKVPIIGFTDSKNLVATVNSTKHVAEKRLRLDVAGIREMVENGTV